MEDKIVYSWVFWFEGLDEYQKIWSILQDKSWKLFLRIEKDEQEITNSINDEINWFDAWMPSYKKKDIWIFWKILYEWVLKFVHLEGIKSYIAYKSSRWIFPFDYMIISDYSLQDNPYYIDWISISFSQLIGFWDSELKIDKDLFENDILNLNFTKISENKKLWNIEGKNYNLETKILIQKWNNDHDICFFVSWGKGRFDINKLMLERKSFLTINSKTNQFLYQIEFDILNIYKFFSLFSWNLKFELKILPQEYKLMINTDTITKNILNDDSKKPYDYSCSINIKEMDFEKIYWKFLQDIKVYKNSYDMFYKKDINLSWDIYNAFFNLMQWLENLLQKFVPNTPQEKITLIKRLDTLYQYVWIDKIFQIRYDKSYIFRTQNFIKELRNTFAHWDFDKYINKDSLFNACQFISVLIELFILKNLWLSEDKYDSLKFWIIYNFVEFLTIRDEEYFWKLYKYEHKPLDPKTIDDIKNKRYWDET